MLMLYTYAQLIIMFIYLCDLLHNTGRAFLENGPDELIVTLVTLSFYPSTQKLYFIQECKEIKFLFVLFWL